MLIVSLIAPLPDAAPQLAPLVAEQDQLANVIPLGGASAAVAPMTLLGPAVPTTIVYVAVMPVATVVTPSVLVIERLAVPVACSVAVVGVVFVTACADVSAPAGTVLIRLPAAVPRTLTLSVQVAPAAIDALDNPTDESPGVAVT